MPRFTYLYVDRMLVFAIHVLTLVVSCTRRLDPDLGTVDAREHVQERRLLVKLGLVIVGLGLRRKANPLVG